MGRFVAGHMSQVIRVESLEQTSEIKILVHITWTPRMHYAGNTVRVRKEPRVELAC
jgi:hypothetical protein